MSVRKLLEGKGDFVPICRLDAKISDVVDQLEVDSAGALLVTDESSNVVGIVSERDIVRALKSHGRDIVDAPVGEVMQSDVVTCDYSQPITRILELMDEHQIRHVPIMRDGKLCGIINMLDLVKYRLHEAELEASALKDYVAGRI